MFFRERRPFMFHVVASIHLYTFLLLLFCVAMLAANGSALVGLGGLDSPRVDTILTVFNLAACALYLYFAIGHSLWRLMSVANVNTLCRALSVPRSYVSDL